MPIVIAKPIIQTYQDLVIADNVDAYFRLEETAGTQADGTGAVLTRNGTWNGTTSLGVAGLISGGTLAADWDGSSNYIQMNNTGWLNITTEDFAVEMWVRSTANTGNITFIDKRNSAGQGEGWLLGMKNGLPTVATKSGSTPLEFSGSTGVADGSIHHLVFNVNRSGTSQIWVDNSLDGTGTLSSTTITNTTSGRIGYKTAAATSFTYFTGTLDEVAFYRSILLTPTQIEDHYNKGL